MQRLEVSGAVRPLYGSLGVKGLKFRHWLLDGAFFVAQAPPNFRGQRSTAMGTVPRVWTQEEVRSVIRAGKFLSTRPTARTWHLRTLVSSPTRKKHLMCG